MTDANPTQGRPIAVPGGHLLPHRFSDSATTTGRRRRVRPGLLIGILGAAAAIVTVGALQVTSNLGYDTAAQQLRDGASSAADLKLSVREANEALVASTDSATLILGSDSGGLIDSAARETMTTAVSTASDATTTTESTLAEAIPSVGTKPGWFWELFGETTALSEDRAAVDQLADDLGDDAQKVDAASSSLTDAGVAAVTAAATAASGLEAAHINARNDNIIALRDAVEAAAATTAIDEQAVASFGTLQTAATQLIESENAELAEKAGPLFTARTEIEAFARSIAPGVLLEFDWAPQVNGYGGNGSMGGYTTWWWDEPGRAVIQLSNSVAEQWPADRSKALVVHEVGHAISVKCADMYDASTQDSIEKWATAWAISMGYTDDANGVWAYGYPPQSYIDAAAGCR